MWWRRRETADIGAYETELYRFLETRRPALLKMLSDQSPLDDRLAGAMDGALREFATAFHSAPQVAAA